jgi:outer membrane protein OmpA-like peptidoglycan-associated protein/tetratricopeptide (TPR) repeat protein
MQRKDKKGWLKPACRKASGPLGYGLLLLMLLVSFSPLFGQKGSLERANRAFENMSYPEAIRLYERALKKRFDKTAMIRLADAYRLTNQYEAAAEQYAQVVGLKQLPPINYFYYAQSLMNNGMYREAAQWFRRYDDAMPSDQRGRRFAESCENIEQFFQDSSDYRLTSYRFNSAQDDFGSSWYQDGIIFASSRGEGSIIKSKYEWTQEPFLDLYVARISESGDGDGRPRLLRGNLNSRFHEAACSVDEENGILYFTRNNYFKGKQKVDKTGVVNLKLFYARIGEKGLEELRSLPFNSDEYSVGHPAIAPDGEHLYFASDMPGGFGGTDLYVVERQDDAWSKPRNLGPQVNTAGNEMFPFLHPNGTLFYASDGLGGLGGLDLFRVALPIGRNASPRNLGVPFNSAFDDFAFVASPDESWGFISSNRPGGRGGDDIYRFAVQRPGLAGVVLDAQTGEPIESADVVARIVATDQTEKSRTGANGRFSILLPAEQNFRVAISAEGYSPSEVVFTTNGIAPGQMHTDTFYLNTPEKRVAFRVLDAETGAGVPNAKVRLIGRQLEYTTDSSGTVALYADPYPEYQVSEAECMQQEEPSFCFRFSDVGGLEMDTMPIVYEWNLGDGTRVRGLEVEHCYSAPGVYHVELNLVDTVSEFVFLTQSSYDLEVRAPEAVYIAGPDTVTRGRSALFDASKSVLSGCNIGSYSWEVNGEPAGTGPVLQRVFPRTGTYEIRLQVAGGAGNGPMACGKCVTRRITVAEPGWQRNRKDSLRELWSAKPAAPPEDIECEPQEPESYCYRFTDTGGMDSDSLPFVYEWDLGDGVRRRGMTVEHCYENPGNYLVRLRILDSYSHQPLMIQTEYEVEVRDVRQVYVESRDSARVGQPVHFDALKSDPREDCTFNAVYWEFGDGNSATGPEVDHSYRRPGDYRVRMVLSGKSNAGGKCEVCTYKEIHVSRDYRGYSLAERQREKTLLSEEPLDPSEMLFLEISKPGYKTKIIPYVSTDTSAIRQDSVRLEPEINEVVLTGMIVAAVGIGPLADVNIMLRDMEGREMRKERSATGSFAIPVPTGERFELIFEKEGYLQERRTLGPYRGRLLPDPIEIKLRRVEIGATVLLQNIFYDFNQHTLRAESKPELDRVARVLEDNPSIRVELGAHTDSRGADDYNLRLSQRRAESAVNYLIRKGIARDRIVARGYGEQRPVNACINGVECDEWAHQANRRTEIKVLGVSNVNFREALLVLEYAEEDSFAARESYSIELGVFDDPLPQNRLPKGRVFLEQGGGLYTYRLKGFPEYKDAEKALVDLRASFPEAVIRSNPGIDPVKSEPREIRALPGMAGAKFFYTIQIAVVGRSTSESFFTPLGPYRKQLQVARVRNLRKYSVCRVETYKEARKHLSQVRARGYQDAFIIAYLDGRPVQIKKALEYEREHGIRQ